MKKLYLGILIAVFLFAAFLPFASASYVCPAAYTSAMNGVLTIQDQHPSDSVYKSAIGECFTANATAYLNTVQVYVDKNSGTPTGCIVAKLYSIGGGVVGSTAYPSSTVLATSSLVDSSTLPGTLVLYTFTFDGSYQMTSSTDYAIVIQAYNETINSINNVGVGRHTSEGTAAMNLVTYANTAWSASTSNELYFIINGDTVSSGATPTPTPPATTGTTDDFWNGSIGTTLTGAIGLILPLLFMFIPAFFFYKFAGAWGFFAGINIGVILSYLFIPAMQQVWIIVVLVIVDGLLLFGKVGLHD